MEFSIFFLAKIAIVLTASSIIFLVVMAVIGEIRHHYYQKSREAILWEKTYRRMPNEEQVWDQIVADGPQAYQYKIQDLAKQYRESHDYIKGEGDYANGSF